jgi:hypothetical protein
MMAPALRETLAITRNSSKKLARAFEEGGWCDFHHHATLCIAAYGLLVSEGDDSPCGSRSPTLLKKLTVPDGYRPAGSAIANRTPRPELDHNDASKVDRRAYQDPVTMSVLRRSNPRAVA